MRTAEMKIVPKPLTLLVASLLFCAGSALAQSFPYVLGDAVYPYSTQVGPPAKGASYVDDTFNTSITRITDWQTELLPLNPVYTTARTDYSTWSPLNSDGTYLMFMAGQGHSYVIYRASAPYAFYKDLWTWLRGWNSQDPEPRWDRSGAHPTWLYYRKDKTLRRLDIGNDSDVVVHDFGPDFPAYGAGYFVWNGEEGNPSSDTRYWAFMLGNSSTNIPLVFVYDMVLDAVVSSKITPFDRPDSVSMSPSGDFILVNWLPTPPYEGDGHNPDIYPRDFSSFFQISGQVPHASWTISAQGNEGVFNLNPSGPNTDYLTFTRAEPTYATFRLYAQVDMGWNASGLLHMTGPANKRGWGFISTYSASFPAEWVQNQIWAIEVDETKVYGNPPATKPRIWRIAFTQNIVDPAAYYFQQPNAQIDPDGTKIWWGSNWRNPASQSQDVLQLTLPANWWTDLSGSSPPPVYCCRQ